MALEKGQQPRRGAAADSTKDATAVDGTASIDADDIDLQVANNNSVALPDHGDDNESDEDYDDEEYDEEDADEALKAPQEKQQPQVRP